RSGKNEGIIYNYINNKKIDWIANREKELKSDKQKLKDKLDASENEYLINIEELNKIYLFEYFKTLKDLHKFKIDKEEFTIEDLIKNENIEVILGSKKLRYFSNNNPYNSQQINITFNEIEKNINRQKNYKQRKSDVQNKITTVKANIIKQIREVDEELKEVKS